MNMLNKALLIDDDRLANLCHWELLTSSNSFRHIHFVHSGQAALDYLANCSSDPNRPDSFPNVIFIDIKMPVMNGFEFVRQFNKTYGDINHTVKICVLSGLTNPSLQYGYRMNQHIDAFLQKPLDYGNLTSLLSYSV